MYSIHGVVIFGMSLVYNMYLALILTKCFESLLSTGKSKWVVAQSRTKANSLYGDCYQLPAAYFSFLYLRLSPTDGEKITSGELEDLVRQVVASGTLLELSSEKGTQQPQELLRVTMTTNSTSLEKFLTALGEGIYDTAVPKSKVYTCTYT